MAKRHRIPTDCPFQAFLETDEARQIMDAEWLADLLRRHRAAVRHEDDLDEFAEDHPEEFQIISLEEIRLGVHSCPLWVKARLAQLGHHQARVRLPVFDNENVQRREHDRPRSRDHFPWTGD